MHKYMNNCFVIIIFIKKKWQINMVRFPKKYTYAYLFFRCITFEFL